MAALWLLALMVAAVSCATEEECMKGCPKILLPVCGSDGKVYSNKCLFEIANCVADGTLKLKEGSFCKQPVARATEAECMKPCNKMYKPVCGSDGKLHSNPCTFEIDQCMADGLLERRDMSFCTGKQRRGTAAECMKICTKEYKPVCGSDGKLHSNLCTFEIDQCMADGLLERRDMSFCSSKQRRGSRADCMKACTKEYNPVCGSDGKLHSNPCTFEIDQCMADGLLGRRDMSFCTSRQRRGTRAECMKACTKEYRPVCGSDGKLHSNPCMFEIDQCMADGLLERRDMSFCTSKQRRGTAAECMKACTKEYKPVCGSDGKLHSNPCTFEIDQCMADGLLERRDMSFCTGKQRRGTAAECMKACTKEYKPVCGSDGKLHSNLCTFEIDQCMADGLLERRDMSFCGSKQRRGTEAECMKACNKMYAPVCGSDRKMYSNKCVFEIAQCMVDGALELREKSFCKGI